MNSYKNLYRYCIEMIDLSAIHLIVLHRVVMMGKSVVASGDTPLDFLHRLTE